jgi:hypothetical protein
MRPLQSTARADREEAQVTSGMQGMKRRPNANGAMVVTVIVAGMMQVPVDDIVGVVTVRNGRVIAILPVLVVRGMATARVRGRTDGRVAFVYVERMRIDAFAVNMVEATILDVVLMAAVANGCMAAAWSVGMKLALMTLVIAHGYCS